jgi:DNA-binding XRE family transcriptional regulator
MLSVTRKERNREKLGIQLKNARVEAGYTQKALASALGLEYYTMISQMELGYISIPASIWVPIATTLKMDRCDWVLRCLCDYQPEIFIALFGNRSVDEAAKVLTLLHKGQLDSLLSASV